MDFNDVATVEFNMPEQVSSLVLNFLSTPRFGRGNNVTALYGSDSFARTEYSRGLMIAGILTVSVYLFWLVFLFVFYCLGHDKVGFLSGEPFHRKVPKVVKRGLLIDLQTPRTYTSSQDSTATESINEDPPPRESWSLNNRPARIRLLFIASGLLFVIAAIWLFARGIASLQGDVASLEQTSLEVDRLAHDAWQTFHDGVSGISAAANSTFQSFRKEKERQYFCPDHKFLDDNSVGARVYEMIMHSLEQLQPLKDLMGDEGTEIDQTLAAVAGFTRDISINMENREIADWRVFLVSIPYIVIPALLVVGAILALSKATSKNYVLFLEYICAPIFFLMVAAAWGVAAYLSITAGANADFCMPGGYVDASPDEAILGILRAKGEDEGVVAVVNWFASQCAIDQDPFKFLREALPELIIGASSLSNLSSAIKPLDVSRALSEYCGRDYGDLQQLVVQLKESVVLLSAAGTQALDTLSCKRIVPLYVDAVYSNMCSSVPTDIFWVFCGCIALGIMGMTMITTRASWQATVFDHSPSGEPVRSLEDSIGQILADDDLSQATSELSEQHSLRTKMEAFKAVTNVGFLQNEAAHLVETLTQQGFGNKLTSRNLDDELFAASLKDTNRSHVQSNDASLTPTTVSPVSDASYPSGSTVHALDGPAIWPLPIEPQDPFRLPFPNPQSGDLSTVDDDAPDPPLMDMDDDGSDGDLADDVLIQKEARIFGPSLLRGTFVEGSIGEDGQEVVLSEIAFSGNDREELSLVPDGGRLCLRSDDQPSHAIAGEGLAEVDDDFFVATDADRQLWNSAGSMY